MCIETGDNIQTFNNVLFGKIFFGLDKIDPITNCPFVFDSNGVLKQVRSVCLQLLNARRKKNESLHDTFTKLYKENFEKYGPSTDSNPKIVITTFSRSSI